jgi:hypothetical protein
LIRAWSVLASLRLQGRPSRRHHRQRPVAAGDLAQGRQVAPEGPSLPSREPAGAGPSAPRR